MPTNDEILNAVSVIRTVAADPIIGEVKVFLDSVEADATSAASVTTSAPVKVASGAVA